MLDPKAFREEYPPQKLGPKLPDRPISSLRDIQHLYGRLYTLATAGGGEYADYLTPDEAADLIGQEESLLAVRVDLTGEQPKLDEDRSVLVTQFTEDHVQKVAHCKYAAARGIDHSITHRSGRDNEPEKLARYAKERLTKWATDGVVTEVASEHEDGQIVDSLADLGADDAVLEDLESAVIAELGGPTTALITVQIRRPGDESFRWPGEIDVFNEAMRARKLSKLTSKGEANESIGTAIDLISGQRTQTVGTAEDPLNYFLGKQLEKFPGLDPDEAWRNHPLSEDAAVTIMNAEEFIDACTYRMFNADIYYLPYFLGSPEPEEIYQLYSVLYNVTEDEEMAPLERAYEEFGDQFDEYGHRLRFYVAAVMKHQMSRYDVYGETLDGSIQYPVEVATEHAKVTGSWVFTSNDASARSPPLPSHEDWDLTIQRQLRDLIAYGGYVSATLPYSDDDTDPSIDDVRIRVHMSILSGEPISRESIVGGYVDRLLDWDGENFPSFLVASQFAQLSALANAGLITDYEQTGAKTTYELVKGPDYETMYQNPLSARTDGGTVPTGRSEKLESFIDQTPDLENPERRGSFLLGVLIGQIGTYQRAHHDRSTTVIDQYPIKSITKSKLKRVTQEVLDKDVVYSREAAKRGSNINSTMYQEVTNEIVETMTADDPDDWEIGTDDLRFYYALGVTYGMNARSTNDESDNLEETNNE